MRLPRFPWFLGRMFLGWIAVATISCSTPGGVDESSGAAPIETPGSAVVLVSLDGFGWDYPDRFSTPTLDRIARLGVRSERMIPSFPSKTFPNHYTIVTGLYPGHHGIVSNTMWDEALGRFGLSRVGLHVRVGRNGVQVGAARRIRLGAPLATSRRRR